MEKGVKTSVVPLGKLVRIMGCSFVYKKHTPPGREPYYTYSHSTSYGGESGPVNFVGDRIQRGNPFKVINKRGKEYSAEVAKGDEENLVIEWRRIK